MKLVLLQVVKHSLQTLLVVRLDDVSELLRAVLDIFPKESIRASYL